MVAFFDTPELNFLTLLRKKMATIRKRKDQEGVMRFQVIVRLKGHDAQYASFVRLTDAKKWAQDTESDIRNGRYFKTTESRKHTLGQMIDKYIREVLPTKKEKCIGIQTTQLLWWKNQIGVKLLSDISPALIGELRDKLLKEPTKWGKQRSNATTVRYMSALSHVFSVCVREWGWIEDNPVRKVKKPTEPRGRVRFLSDEERVRLLNACKASSNEFLYPIVVVALATGMRLSEVSNMRYESIDFDKGRISLDDQKNGERSIVPLVGFALQVVLEHKNKNRKDIGLLFPSKENPNKPMDIRFPWNQALKSSQIKDFTFHSLRHSAASYLARNGCSLIEVQKILRHKSISQTVRYSHLCEDHISSAVADMNQKIFANNG
jgi:integrase